MGGIRHHEVDTAVFVVALGGRKIQLGEGNPSGASLVEYPERFAHNGVVLDLFGVSIAVDQHSLGTNLGHLALWFERRRWRLLLAAKSVDFCVQLIDLILLGLSLLRIIVRAGSYGDIRRIGLRRVCIGVRWIRVIGIIPADSAVPSPTRIASPAPTAPAEAPPG